MYKDAICTFSAFLLGLVLKLLGKMDFTHFFSVLQQSSNDIRENIETINAPMDDLEDESSSVSHKLLFTGLFAVFSQCWFIQIAWKPMGDNFTPSNFTFQNMLKLLHTHKWP